MTIGKLNFHYPKGKLQSVYSHEEMTALELAAATSGKVDEVVDMVNGVEQSAIEARQIVDVMRNDQDNFILENDDARSQIVTDNQAFIDGLTTSKATFETTLTEDLTTFKESIETSKTNFEANLNDEIDVIVDSAEGIILSNVNNKIDELITDGTINNLINVDTEISIVEATGVGVINGLNVLPQSNPNASVLISAGTAHLWNGKRYSQVDNKTINIVSADALYPRIDVVYINEAGVLSYGKGEAKTIPTTPTPINALVLAEIFVNVGTSAITTNIITDKRIIKTDTNKIKQKVNEIVNIAVTDFYIEGQTDWSNAFQRVSDYVNSLPDKIVKVYFPLKTYNYSFGLHFTKEIILYGDGAILNYIGSGKALSIGADGLTILSPQTNHVHTIEGLTFTGGANMTHGLYFNSFIAFPRLNKVKFLNFGNKDAYCAFFQSDNWDILITDCDFYSVGGTGKNWIRVHGENKSGVWDNGNSRLRVSDCHGSMQDDVTGTGISVNGTNPTIVNCKIEGFIPNIHLDGWTSFAIIDNCYFEADKSGVACIEYGGTDPRIDGNYLTNLTISNCYSNQHNADFGTNTFFVAPKTNKAGLQSARIINNRITGYSQDKEMIKQNPLGSQIGNIAENNTGITIIHSVGVATWGGNQGVPTFHNNVDEAAYLKLRAGKTSNQYMGLSFAGFDNTDLGLIQYGANHLDFVNKGQLGLRIDPDGLLSIVQGRLIMQKQIEAITATNGTIFEDTDGVLKYKNLAGVTRELTNPIV